MEVITMTTADKAHYDKLIALFNAIFDDNFRKNLMAAKAVGMDHVVCSVPVSLLKGLIIDLP